MTQTIEVSSNTIVPATMRAKNFAGKNGETFYGITVKIGRREVAITLTQLRAMIQTIEADGMKVC